MGIDIYLTIRLWVCIFQGYNVTLQKLSIPSHNKIKTLVFIESEFSLIYKMRKILDANWKIFRFPLVGTFSFESFMPGGVKLPTQFYLKKAWPVEYSVINCRHTIPIFLNYFKTQIVYHIFWGKFKTSKKDNQKNQLI